MVLFHLFLPLPPSVVWSTGARRSLGPRTGKRSWVWARSSWSSKTLTEPSRGGRPYPGESSAARPLRPCSTLSISSRFVIRPSVIFFFHVVWRFVIYFFHAVWRLICSFLCDIFVLFTYHQVWHHTASLCFFLCVCPCFIYVLSLFLCTIRWHHGHGTYVCTSKYDVCMHASIFLFILFYFSAFIFFLNFGVHDDFSFYHRMAWLTNWHSFFLHFGVHDGFSFYLQMAWLADICVCACMHRCFFVLFFGHFFFLHFGVHHDFSFYLQMARLTSWHFFFSFFFISVSMVIFLSTFGWHMHDWLTD